MHSGTSQRRDLVEGVTYQGRTITDLAGLVDRFLPAVPQAPGWLILAHAKTHLANRTPMDTDDIEAWYLLTEYEQALLAGYPLKCEYCDGDGSVPANSNDCDGTLRCERCKGTGKLW